MRDALMLFGVMGVVGSLIMGVAVAYALWSRAAERRGEARRRELSRAYRAGVDPLLDEGERFVRDVFAAAVGLTPVVERLEDNVLLAVADESREACLAVVGWADGSRAGDAVELRVELVASGKRAPVRSAYVVVKVVDEEGAVGLSRCVARGPDLETVRSERWDVVLAQLRKAFKREAGWRR